MIQTTEDIWQCHNGVKDHEEGDVDCGGLCFKKCVEKQGCAKSEDCTRSLQCVNNVCEQAFVIPVVGVCCSVVCVFLIVSTFVSHIKRKVCSGWSIQV